MFANVHRVKQRMLKNNFTADEPGIYPKSDNKKKIQPQVKNSNQKGWPYIAQDSYEILLEQ